jgi:hypothetical protein
MLFRQPGGIVGDLLLLLLRLNFNIRQQKQNKALLGSDFLPLMLDAGNCCCRISSVGAVSVREAAVKTAEYIRFGIFGKKLQLLPLNFRKFTGSYRR